MKKKAITTLRCLILDDEQKAHQALRELIRTISWLEVTGSCYSVTEAMDVILGKQPDIIFLDINMPGLTGLDLLKSLPEPRPHIILITAHKEYALEGYEHEVFDFLLKPVDPGRFLRTVLKVARQVLSDRQPSIRPVFEAVRVTPSPAKSDKGPQSNIWIRADGKNFQVAVDEIYALTGLRDYVKVLFKDGMLVTYSTLSAMRNKLPKGTFVRIHRSHVINRNAIKSIDGNIITLHNGKEFSIGARGVPREAIIRELTQDTR